MKKTWLSLLALCLFGLAGCKANEGQKPPGNNMMMSPPDLSMAVESCENMKCEDPDAKCCLGEACVDTKTNPLHCGACGKVCKAREICTDGACVCRGAGPAMACAIGTSCCTDGCRDLQNDLKNCGGCGLGCKMGEDCKTGKCSCGATGMACKSGQICCGASGCSNLQDDPNNCGMCGKKCAAGKACKSGVCEGECVPCSMGETCCDGICANILNDNMNCGRCGNKCGDVFGIPLPCLFGFCAFAMPDGGDGGMPMDMSMPKD